MTPHNVYCEHGYFSHTCDCSGPHTTRTIICDDPAHQKENSVTTDTTETAEQLEARLAELRAQQDEATFTAEQADLAEAGGGYSITPAADTDLEDDEEETEPEPTVLTAFLVVVQPDGSSLATPDLSQISQVVPVREATFNDMRRACQDVVHDINNVIVSQQTVGLMHQSAQELAEQQRSAKVAAKLASKGIRVPGRG